jgi:hypothetical protein
MLDISLTSLITPQAEEIYQWLVKKENIGKTWSSQDLSKRFKPDPSTDLFWKLRLLRDHRIRIENKGYWDFRVFVSESPAPELTLSPLPLSLLPPQIVLQCAQPNARLLTKLPLPLPATAVNRDYIRYLRPAAPDPLSLSWLLFHSAQLLASASSISRCR